MTPRSDSADSYVYDAAFLDYATRVNFASAQCVAAILQPLLRLRSVLDVGCAQGAWLRAWKETGVTEFTGVDGDYVDRRRLQIGAEHFVPHDVSQPFDLGRIFDLVQCLEVAEHLPAAHAGTLIDNLTRHGTTILFSAAPPGQGGENHINERPYEYWRALFRERGYAALDGVRALVKTEPGVASWYRYNMFLYARTDIIATLPRSLAESLVPAHLSLKDISPLPHRLRKAMIRALPFAARQMLAKAKGRLQPFLGS